MSLRDVEHRGVTSLPLERLDEIFHGEMAAGLARRLLGGSATSFGDPRGTPYGKARSDQSDLALLADVPLTRTGGTFVHLYGRERGSYRSYQLYAIGYGPVSLGAQGRRLIAQFESAVDAADPTRDATTNGDRRAGVAPDPIPGQRAIGRDGRDLGEIVAVVGTLIDVEGAVDRDGVPIGRVFRSDLDLAATRATGARDGREFTVTELVPGLRAIGRDGRDLGEITDVVSTLISVTGETGADGAPITKVFRSDLDVAATLATGPVVTDVAAPAARRRASSSNGGSASDAHIADATTPMPRAESLRRRDAIDTGPWSTEQFREINARLAERGIAPVVRDGHLYVSARARPAAMRVIDEVVGDG